MSIGRKTGLKMPEARKKNIARLLVGGVVAGLVGSLSVGVQAAAQRVNAWEYSVDIPWRIEPMTNYASGNQNRYGSIPIYVVIADAFMKDHSASCVVGAMADFIPCDIPEWPTRVRWVDVKETVANGNVVTKRYTPEHFFSIERTVNYWRVNSRAEAFNATPLYGPGGVPTELQVHQLKCSVTEALIGGGCGSSDAYVADTSEWHGLIYHAPREKTSGKAAVLTIEVAVEMDNGSTKLLKSTLRTLLAPDALPKFDAGWAYGDLHYHSQGTDNMGEMGYSYAATLHAMKSIGLDFVFATDHASNNEQIAVAAYTDGTEGYLWEYDLWNTFSQQGDMSPNRWKNHWHLLNGAAGNPYTGRQGVNDNGEVVSYISGISKISNHLGAYVLPQIFLGGEVDVIPEVNQMPGEPAGLVAGGRMATFRACSDLPHWLKIVLGSASDDFDFTSGVADSAICPSTDLYIPSGDGTWLVRNVTGLELNYGRQHLLHLPSDGSRDDAGVMSNTTLFGAASRRHKDMLAEEYEEQGKGYHFLAHPVTMAKGAGVGRMGPDIMPYSEVQLKEAMKSPYVLGLQAWNENEKLESPVRSTGFFIDNSSYTEMDCQEKVPVHGYMDYCIKPKVRDSYGLEVDIIQPDKGYEYNPYYDVISGSYKDRKYTRWQEIFAGITLFDAVNMWSINKNFSQLDWLGVNEPRKWFLAGGSDAHGDLNHRRDGYYKGTTTVNDTAIGKPRNLVYTGQPEKSVGLGRGYTQSQVIDGLKSGQFSVTDGPAVRIAIDRNNNGVIDAGDIMMGRHLALYSITPDTNLNILVEFKSTEEFGKVQQINLWAGVRDNQAGYETRYGPANDPLSEIWFAGEYTMPVTHKVYTHVAYGAYTYNHDFKRAAYTAWGEYYDDESRGYHAISGMQKTYGILKPYSGVHKFTITPGQLRALNVVPQLVNGEDARRIMSGSTPDAMWFRADVVTERVGGNAECSSAVVTYNTDRCLQRFGVTNPVWVVKQGWKN